MSALPESRQIQRREIGPIVAKREVGPVDPVANRHDACLFQLRTSQEQDTRFPVMMSWLLIAMTEVLIVSVNVAELKNRLSK